MTHRNSDRLRPKVFGDAHVGRNFDATLDKAKEEKKLHERGLENKTRWSMGQRNSERAAKAKEDDDHHPAQYPSRAPVTLATVKWGKPDVE